MNAWERYFEQPFTEMNFEWAELSKASLVVRWLNGVYFVKLNHTWGHQGINCRVIFMIKQIMI